MQIHEDSKNHDGQRARCECVLNQPIHRCVPKYTKILFFDGIARKFDFINWILDLRNILIIGRFVMKKR
jgi:hypothetical protein